MIGLTRSYRYAPDSGIHALAEAVRTGDRVRALALLADERHTDVSLHRPSRGELSPVLRQQVVQGFKPFLSASNPEEALRLFARFRVLCAHRAGPEGSERLNRRIEETLRAAELIHSPAEFYRGRPIGITHNDYGLNLFNGDVGVWVQRNGEGAFFLDPGGRPRLVPLARLPAHELVYAMSVHKSQGSEFERVALCLPSGSSPVLSREWLYTAITRARAELHIFATPEAVAEAIDRPLRRTSGLQDLLASARDAATGTASPPRS